MRTDYLELKSWGADLRMIRANRPKFAASGDRARTFGAALEQAEQLWRASEVVDPIASPLLLFYGLTQAGRAICASGVPGNEWRPAERRGLDFKFDQSPPDQVCSTSGRSECLRSEVASSSRWQRLSTLRFWRLTRASLS